MISKTIVVYGEPKGKARPRTVWTNGFVQTYTPKPTRDYEAKIRNTYKAQAGNKFITEIPLRLIANIYFKIPQSFSKKKTEMAITGQLRPMKMPDIDNILKCLMDALNKVAYEDDKQVVEVKCKKFYSEQERIEITLEEIVW